jgi:hypothetical protein
VTPSPISATTLAEIERVGREWPDGVHTCAELQQLEPGRRPCTCGRCDSTPAPADRWTALREEIRLYRDIHNERASDLIDEGKGGADLAYARADELGKVLATMDRMAGQ